MSILGALKRKIFVRVYKYLKKYVRGFFLVAIDTCVCAFSNYVSTTHYIFRSILP